MEIVLKANSYTKKFKKTVQSFSVQSEQLQLGVRVRLIIKRLEGF